MGCLSECIRLVSLSCFGQSQASFLGPAYHHHAECLQDRLWGHTQVSFLTQSTQPPLQLVMTLEDFLLRTALSGVASTVCSCLRHGPQWLTDRESKTFGAVSILLIPGNWAKAELYLRQPVSRYLSVLIPFLSSEEGFSSSPINCTPLILCLRLGC